MPRVSHRASSAKTRITPNRRQASKRPAGLPRTPSPGKATRPERPPALERLNRAVGLRGQLNRALWDILEKLSSAQESTGPAGYVHMVLYALLCMLESTDPARQEAMQRAAVAFARVVRGESPEASAERVQAPAGGDESPSAAPSSPPPRSDVRRPADPHLRALGIEFHACVDELGQATIADMMALLFVGDDDPTLAIQDSVRRDVRIIRDALQSANGVDMVDTEAIDMALWQIESRLIVARELHMRMREAMGDERAHRAAAKGGRS
ncbi:hypothetical protein WMF18_01720 [Sorangium sp. So ce315]|uniref:hypothetical protein n=1 Tax=Sorangium sp. So ce315 TaxID=3133299 RepID=UPI003F607F1E